MDRTQLNDLLLSIGLSTTGLAFGMSIPIFFRLLTKSLSLRKYRWAKGISYVIIAAIVVSTVGVVVFQDHVTARRTFLLLSTSAACVALALVRNVGWGERRQEE